MSDHDFRTMDALTQAETYLSALFGPYAEMEGCRIELRPLAPKYAQPDEPAPRRWYPISDIPRAAKDCIGWAKVLDIYCGVLPRCGKGRASDVLWAQYLYLDVDGGDDGPTGSYALAKAARVPLPHIAVTSGSGAHLYWKLHLPVYLPDDGARHEYKGLLKRLAQRVGGEERGAHADTTASDCARILRVPGSWNWKHEGHPRPVVLTRCKPDAECLSYEAWLSMLPPPPPPVYRRPPANVGPSPGITDGLRAWASKGVPEGSRHHSLLAGAVWLVRDKGLTKADALDLIREKAAASPGSRRITEDELADLMTWA